jgi:hypothetical protein
VFVCGRWVGIERGRGFGGWGERWYQVVVVVVMGDDGGNVDKG